MASSPSFHIFSNLPSELRIKIWKFNLPEPRVIPIRFNRSVNQYTSTENPPSMLHACTESRAIFLSVYTKFILNPKYDSNVFVDFVVDTIFFDSIDCSPDGDLSHDLAQSPHRDRILSCAIDSQLWEVLRVFRDDPISEVELLRNLNTIALVLRRNSDLGLHGSINPLMAVDSHTVGTEIQHVQWYIQALRLELKHGLNSYFGRTPPTIQMWLW